MSSIDVLTVGHALVDVQASSSDEFLASEGLVKGAMQLIDDDRARQIYQQMGPANETSGGSGANTATGVVACGATAAFVGTVSFDQLGEIFIHDIRASGVKYETPPISGRTTGTSLILVTPDGERTMNTCIGAAEEVSIANIAPELLKSSKITYVEGYLLDDRFSTEDWERISATIHEAGNLFAITLSDPFCVERHRPVFQELLSGNVDICFGNEEEVKALYQTDDLDSCLVDIAKRTKFAAVTQGGNGSLVCGEGGEWVKIDAVPVGLVDTTGAGDFYAAGFLAGLAKGWPVGDCGRLGSTAAGMIVSQMGARLGDGVTIGLA